MSNKMVPSLSGTRLGERVHSIGDAIQDAANNNGERGAVRGWGFTTNDGQSLTSFLNGLVDDEPLAELFNAVKYVSDHG
jgi:hypothetical protein